MTRNLNRKDVERLLEEIFMVWSVSTSKHGGGISGGKLTEGYLRETSQLQMAPEVMQRLGIAVGDVVRLTNEAGQVEVPVIAAKKGELPSGMLFIAYGDVSSRLMGGDTHGSGMPTSKGLDVELEIVEGAAPGDD